MEDTIIGLKTNVKRGFSLAEFWETSYGGVLKTTLTSWKMMEDAGLPMEPIIPLVWAEATRIRRYREVESSTIGLMSKIGEMVIPAKTYTTKKGVEKTTPEQRVPAHYSQGGKYLGRVSDLGTEPISYRIDLQITPKHFKFIGIGETIEGCFELKTLEELATADTTDITVKDIKHQAKALKAKGGAGEADE